MPANPLKRLMGRREVTPVRSVHRSAKTPRYGVVTKKRSRREERPDRQPGLLSRAVNDWWNRLIGAVFGGKLSEQTEQYLAHQTKRDYVCNTAGQAAWGMLFPLLTMVATWLVGAEQAGLFSMAFTVGTLLLFLANYGVRTYQVSDLDEMRSFLDYQIQRFLTCALMLLVGWMWCRFRGYDDQMFAVCMGVLVFRAVDGLADVYEGRLQQKDKLYLAGLSQAARCVLGLVAFSVILFLTRNLAVASFAMAVGGVASLLLLTAPLAFFETEKSLPASFRGIRRRFELLGKLYGAALIADYAHHPREIAAALTAAKEAFGGRLFVVFQPHTYSRTRLLFDDFVAALQDVERLVIYKTYPAREYFDAAGSALTLAEHLPNALYVETTRELSVYLRCSLRAGDAVLFLGAGDIYFIAKRLPGAKL